MLINRTRFSICKRIILATIVIVVAFSAVNVFNYVQSLKMQHGYDEVVNSAPVISLVKDINAELWLQNAQIRGYVLTGDSKYLKSFENSRNRIEANYEQLDQMLLNEDAKKISRILRVVINEYNKQQDNTINVRNKLGPEQAVKFIAATGERTEAIGFALQSIAATISKTMDNKVVANKLSATRGQQIVLFISIAIFITALCGGIWQARHIARPLEIVAEEARLVAAGDLSRQMPTYLGNDEIADLIQAFSTMVTNLRAIVNRVNASAIQVALSSEELKFSAEQSAIAAGSVAQTVTEVAAGASNQLRALENAVSISLEMVDTINHIANSASEVSVKSNEASTVAATGGKTVEKAVSQMSIINGAVNQSVAVVDRLGKSSREIGEIVDVIRNIAGQTNLLALNAAIEAARAGEAGRGFAVVADEVRKLAEQSQIAAQKITQIVSYIQQETSTAVKTMSAGSIEVTKGTEAITVSGNQFNNIIELVQNLDGQIMNINAAAQQLSASSETVASSVSGIKIIAAETASGAENISAATEEQSASMQQIAAASQAMSHVADDLKAEVSRFKL
jgi:methyl-accepting chemotaxis protein